MNYPADGPILEPRNLEPSRLLKNSERLRVWHPFPEGGERVRVRDVRCYVLETPSPSSCPSPQRGEGTLTRTL